MSCDTWCVTWIYSVLLDILTYLYTFYISLPTTRRFLGLSFHLQKSLLLLFVHVIFCFSKQKNLPFQEAKREPLPSDWGLQEYRRLRVARERQAFGPLWCFCFMASSAATPRTPLRKKGLRGHCFCAGKVGWVAISVGRFCPGNTPIDLKFNTVHLEMMVCQRNLLFPRSWF